MTNCEFCETAIKPEDPSYEDCNGIIVCKACAPMLSDVIEQHEEILSSVPFRPGDLGYENRKDMLRHMNVMKAWLAQGGDRSMAEVEETGE